MIFGLLLDGIGKDIAEKPAVSVTKSPGHRPKHPAVSQQEPSLFPGGKFTKLCHIRSYVDVQRAAILARLLCIS